MPITSQQLLQILPNAGAKAGVFVPVLNTAMGLIQITGRANYAACGEALALNLINQPELLEQPKNACLSAAWFWATNGLNTLADAGDFEKITRRINGGLNGQADRLKLWTKATEVLV